MKMPNSHNKDSKQLVCVHYYFYPDNSAGSQMLSDISFYLSSNSFEVTVITSRYVRYDVEDKTLINYEEINGVNVYRVWSSNFGRRRIINRVINYITLEISLMIKLFQIVKQNDTVLLLTEPPFFNIIAYPIIRLKKGVVVNWVQDLFPEVAVSAGLFSKSSLINRSLTTLRNFIFKKADKNIVIGNTMLDYLVSIGISNNTIKIVNWSKGGEIFPISHNDNQIRKDWGLEGKFVIGYSGNLGRAHDVSTILAVIDKLKFNNNILFLFIGCGDGFDTVKQYAAKNKLNNIMFKPYQNRDLLPLSLNIADVHWVTLDPKMEGFIVPSKFYGILAAGKPVIFIGDREGEIARDIRKGECGESVIIGNYKRLEEIIKQYSNNVTLLSALGQNSRKLFEEKYQFHISAVKFYNLLTDIGRNIQ